MKRKNYIFTNKKHSEKGILSAILGTISLASLGIVLYLAYKRAGDVPVGYGLTGLLAACFSIAGLVLGVVTVKDKEVFRLFPVLGIVLNLLVLAVLMFLVHLAL